MKTKHYLFILSFIMILSSCLKSDYNNSYNIQVIGTTEIKNNNVIIHTDQGNILNIKEGKTDKIKDKMRILLYGSVIDNKGQNSKESNIKLYQWDSIKVKNIIELKDTTTDMMKNEPIYLNNSWIANNYLTIQFVFYSSINPSKPHKINLIKKEISENGEILFLLKHNNEGDNDNLKVYSGIISFPINDLINDETKSVKYKITFRKDKDVEETKEFNWDKSNPYNKNNSANQHFTL